MSSNVHTLKENLVYHVVKLAHNLIRRNVYKFKIYILLNNDFQRKWSIFMRICGTEVMDIVLCFRALSDDTDNLM